MASSEPQNGPVAGEAEAKPQTSFFGRLRAYFFTGLVITAPIAITIWATYWFVTLVDGWIKPFIPGLYNPDNYLPFKVPGFGLVSALVVITIIGALAANLVGRTMIMIWDKVLNSTPIVRSIYKGSKQIFQTIFAQKGNSFRYVCLVEWPRKGTWSIAFVSREVDGGEVGLEPGRAMYAVYVSTTPNPTSGYVFFVDKAEVEILPISVEDGLKLVISMGLVFPDEPIQPKGAKLAAPTRKPKPRKAKPAKQSQ